MKRVLVAGIMCCAIIVSDMPVYGMWVGQSQLNPFVQVEGIFESNIYQTYTDEESDFITVISPGIHFQYPTAEDAEMKFSADYRADIRMYGNDGDAKIDPDGELNTVDHRLGADLLFDLASGVELAAGYVFNATSDTPSAPGDERDPYKEHDLSGSVAYKYADTYKVEFAYDGMFRAFDDSEDSKDDITQNDFQLIGFYNLSPILALLVGGNYAMITREDPFIDSDEWKAYGGLEVDVTGKTTGRLKVGMVGRQFDSELDAIEDPTDFYVDGVIESEYVEGSFLNVRLFRKYYDTSITEETAANGLYYIRNGIRGDIRHVLPSLPNLSLLANVGYSKDTYQRPLNLDLENVSDREDTNWEFGAGLEYKFYKYLSLGAGYQYISADSTIDENDYTDNLATIRLKGIL